MNVFFCFFLFSAVNLYSLKKKKTLNEKIQILKKTGEENTS